MISVPEAARRVGRNPESVRRWIREGKLPARKIGTQHFIEEDDLAEFDRSEYVPLPPELRVTMSGKPMPDFLAILRRQRASH
jgi:excisionase family DNA binding protein